GQDNYAAPAGGAGRTGSRPDFDRRPGVARLLARHFARAAGAPDWLFVSRLCAVSPPDGGGQCEVRGASGDGGPAAGVVRPRGAGGPAARRDLGWSAAARGAGAGAGGRSVASAARRAALRAG